MALTFAAAAAAAASVVGAICGPEESRQQATFLACANVDHCVLGLAYRRQESIRGFAGSLPLRSEIAPFVELLLQEAAACGYWN